MSITSAAPNGMPNLHLENYCCFHFHPTKKCLRWRKFVAAHMDIRIAFPFTSDFLFFDAFSQISFLLRTVQGDVADLAKFLHYKLTHFVKPCSLIICDVSKMKIFAS